MQISKINIKNILGITELEITPEGFTEISAKNGKGKTSVLDAIKAALKGGHDATLLRVGEKVGEVVLVLDDGTEITKRVTQNDSTSKVKQDGVLIKKPTDALKSLVDMMSVNPVEFLRAPKKDRVKVLLETMPIQVDIEKLEKMSGVEITTSVDGLPLLDFIRKQVYEERTGTNRAVKEKEATINQLELAMPASAGGVEGSEDELREKVQQAAQAKDAEFERVRVKLDGLKAKNQDEIDAIRAELQVNIDKLKEEAIKKVDSIKAAQAEFESKAEQQKEKTRIKFEDTVAPINAAIQAITLDRANAAKREQAIQTIAQMKEDLAEMAGIAEESTRSIEDIDAYKIELLAALPIRGLEVIDGDIFRDGIQFDHLNTAQQVDIAVEIAKLRAGDLGVICVDGIELLDSSAFEDFKQKAIDSGLQLFVSRVSDEDTLNIKTSN